MSMQKTKERARSNRVGYLLVLVFGIVTTSFYPVVIESSGGLSEDQIEEMVKKAEQFSEEDKKRKERIEALNYANSVIYDIEGKLSEYKVPQEKVSDDL